MWIKRKDTSPISLHSDDSKAVFKMASGLKKIITKLEEILPKVLASGPYHVRHHMCPRRQRKAQEGLPEQSKSDSSSCWSVTQIWWRKAALNRGKTRLNFVRLTLKTIVVKTKKTFCLFCICHASWFAQKSHATFSANQTKNCNLLGRV